MPTEPLVRILVIDDEAIIRLDAREILEDAGYVLADGKSIEAILTDIADLRAATT